MSQYAHLSTPDVEYSEMVKSLPSRDRSQSHDVAVARKGLELVGVELKRILGPSLPKDTEYNVLDHKIESINGEEFEIRCLVPTPAGQSEETSPLLVWYHGGGWAAGQIDQDDYDLRMMCVEVGICIVNVNYRRAPEHLFPTFIEDSYAALKWALTNAPELHASPAKGFIISGQSAGGEIAAVLSHWARDDPFFQGEGKRLTGQLLQYPLVLHPASESIYKEELVSMEQNNDPTAPMLTGGDCSWYAGTHLVSPLTYFTGYIGLTKASATDPNFSPILFPSHSNLPPMVMMICGMDPLRDQDFLYERVLRESGVKTRTYVYAVLS
ncbi:uncharacterized protein STEHIDRAFT_67589 [Stereum hirsutum FP-91666 SS1]|uniref:uncharacterized protein n=1 Tax=Stereum hirsutum (strain FP-91666) TaxID=721885 RepID=UPI00044496AD|nr:uncharacterized protein STEHIDRAFT_67589 [Stereum hirsutum FP-91666 SS1]EIM80571.1 hypothetical protein STEHIDRAFT_67589 [Stereum hirsutum FP-91666 SS1]